MNYLFVILILAITGILCCICFYIGAKVGQTVIKDREINLPTVNPLKSMREYEERKEAEKKQEQLNTILQNIECYDGTSNGQKDV